MKNRSTRSTSLAAGSMVLIVSACGGGLAGVSDGSGPGETITLRGVTAWEANAVDSIGFFLLKEEVERLSHGQMKIEFTGGPEAIPPEEQATAVRTGIADIASLSTAYYASEFPAGNVLNFSELPVEEEDGPPMNYLNKLHVEALNSRILGRSVLGQLALYTGEEVQTTEDLGSLRFRVSPTYIPLMEGLGAEFVEIDSGEIYSALERGVIDGYGWPTQGVTDMGLHELTRCEVLPHYWQVSNVNIINVEVWKSLTAAQQEILVEASAAVEKSLPTELEEYRTKEENLFQQEGVHTCRLTDGDEFDEIASDSGWKWMQENVSASQAARLQELFRR